MIQIRGRLAGYNYTGRITRDDDISKAKETRRMSRESRFQGDGGGDGVALVRPGPRVPSLSNQSARFPDPKALMIMAWQM